MPFSRGHILRITCIFWLVAKFMSIDAWLANRQYPVIPLLQISDNLPPLLHQALFYASVSLLISILIFPKKTGLLTALLVCEIASCLLDVLRWQPWEYQYIFTLFIFIFHGNHPKRQYAAMVLIMASTYVYSGLHKLNGGFLHTIWDSMMLHRFFGLSAEIIQNTHLHYVGLVLPAIEIIAGLALLFLKNKRIPAMVLLGMQAFILVFVGPFGLNYNPIVWPWNLAMMLMLYTLFIGNYHEFRISETGQGFNKIVILFWGVLPALSFVGCWDNHLSSSLYSGQNLQMAICVEKTQVPELEPFFGPDKHFVCSGNTMLQVQKWAMKETGLPPYPEAWYYSKLRDEWEAQHPNVQARCLLYSYPFKQHEEIK